MNPFLAQFQDQPALIEEGRATWLEACLTQVAARMGEIEKAATSANDDFWFAADDWRSSLRPYVVKNGILHVPVKGVLMNDFPYAFGTWATGYEYIWKAIQRGVDDSAVKGIALVVNSGGGRVAGNFDLVDRIYSVRGKKPIRGFAAESAYSAAYNIIAATEHVTVARTGGVGSIGVVIVQMEVSRALDAEGVTVNIIRSKPDKMAGNPYEALSESARKRMQNEVDHSHKEFVALVARNRGMSVEAVDSTDAHTFMAHEAIENGLADEVGALDDAITAFEAILSKGNATMAEITQAELDAAVAAATTSATAAGKAEGITEGTRDGAAAAVARINAIIGSDVGKARPAAALNAALKTSMNAEEATAFLATLPEEAKPSGAGAPAGMLKSAMRGSLNPEVAVGDEDDKTEKSRAEKTLAMVRGQ